MAVVTVDNIASDVAGKSQKVGELPEGMSPAPGVGGAEKIHIAPLGYRGSGSNGGYVAVYSATGSIYIWTNTTDRYYFGQVVVPLLA